MTNENHLKTQAEAFKARILPGKLRFQMAVGFEESGAKALGLRFEMVSKYSAPEVQSRIASFVSNGRADFHREEDQDRQKDEKRES
jgi:hypothetical protein